jgi:hypothetical protein
VSEAEKGENHCIEAGVVRGVHAPQIEGNGRVQREDLAPALVEIVEAAPVILVVEPGPEAAHGLGCVAAQCHLVPDVGQAHGEHHEGGEEAHIPERLGQRRVAAALGWKGGGGGG